MKDNWTAIGIGGALVCVFIAMFMDGSNPAVLMKPSPLILVFGGTFFAAASGYMKTDLKNIKAQIMSGTVKAQAFDPVPLIDIIVQLASTAKTQGLLSLEKAAKDIEDPFLRLCCETIADGPEGDEARDVLEGEIEAMAARHRAGGKFFGDMGGFAPTLGIIGTVMGLVHVLGNLSSPGTLGPAIGSAFTATLWGVLSANLIWLPISNKLKRASELESQGRRMIVEGMLAIGAGVGSRAVRARLESFLPPGLRATKEAA